MKGKVKSIAATIADGTYVFWKSLAGPMWGVIVKSIETGQYIDLRGEKGDRVWIETWALKTLVVEYIVPVRCKDQLACQHQHCNCNVIEVLPLKQSQWQAAIDNGEVDSHKKIEFEIVSTSCDCVGMCKHDNPDKDCTNKVLAKIIPQKKQDIDITCSLGIGDGKGQLLVYGGYKAIKLLQEKLLAKEKMVTVEEMHTNMRLYMEHCEKHGYTPPAWWIKNHKYY